MESPGAVLDMCFANLQAASEKPPEVQMETEKKDPEASCREIFVLFYRFVQRLREAVPRKRQGNWWYRPIYFLIVVSRRGVALSRAVAGCTELCQETACSGCSTYFVLKLLGAFGCFWYNDVVACLLLTM